MPLDPLVTTDELASYLQDTEEALTSRGVDLTLAVTKASGVVRDDVGHPLSLDVDDVHLVVGNEALARSTVLPHFPVTDVSATDTDSAPVQVQVVPATGEMWRADGAVLGELIVTYTHGHNPVPEGVKAIVLAVAARYIVNPAGMRSQTIGDYQAGYGPAGLALTDHERDQLDRYR